MANGGGRTKYRAPLAKQIYTTIEQTMQKHKSAPNLMASYLRAAPLQILSIFYVFDMFRFLFMFWGVRGAKSLILPHRWPKKHGFYVVSIVLYAFLYVFNVFNGSGNVFQKMLCGFGALGPI